MTIKLKAERYWGRGIEEIEIDTDNLANLEFERERFRNLRESDAMLLHIIDRGTVVWVPEAVRTKYEVRNGIKIAMERGARLEEVEVFNLLFRVRRHLESEAVALMRLGPRGEEWILLCADNTKFEFRMNGVPIKRSHRRSYTNAAVKLGYTQSTITAHIQALEEGLGGEVFTYVKRELKLTSLGKELLPLVDELLHSYNRISQMKNRDKVSGELRIAAPESLTISRLGPILKEYLTRYPDVKLILSNGTCGQNQKDLMSGHVDVAFMVWTKLESDDCVHHELHHEEIVFVTAPGKIQSFDEYKQNGTAGFFITNEEGCSYRSMFERYLANQKLPAFQTMELWSLEAIKKAVMSGLGFAALPYVTVKDEVEQGLLNIMEHKEEFEPLYSYVLVKPKKWHPPAVQKFLELTLEAI